MPTILKKLTLSFLSALIVLFSFAPYFSVKAVNDEPKATPAPVGTWYNSSFGDWYNKVYNENISPGNEIFGERYTAAQVQWVIYGIWAFIFNIAIPQEVTSCLFTNTTDLSACNTELQNLLDGKKATGNLTLERQPENQSLLSEVFAERPLSGISYIRYTVSKFSVVPTANAAGPGFGYDALAPIRNMWSAFRDIAFGFFVITAVIFAFMIMFRVKISPQVVITVQSAIPKLIIALILVTFSYAIAGFLIDLMYVVIGLISLIMAPLIPTIAPSLGTISPQSHVYTAPEVFNLLTMGKVAGSLNPGAGTIFNLIFTYLTPWLVVAIILAITLALTIPPPIGIFVGLGLLVVVIVMLLIFIFKIIFALFKAFANIVFLTIFAPLQLALGPLVPNLSFGQWIKSYFSNLSVFIVTGVLWLFAWIFGLLAWRGLGGTGGSFITPTASSDSWPPLLGSNQFGTTLLFAGASFVMFSLIPKATEIIQGFISGKPFAYGSAVGEAVVGPILGGIKLASTATDIGSSWRTRFGPKATPAAPPPIPSTP